ncbi:21352_t:CDS:1, partial [Racocetra persica]
ARQGLPGCPSETDLQCNFVQETQADVSLPPCDSLAICYYDTIHDKAFCKHVDDQCVLGESIRLKSFCTIPNDGSRCGFTCSDCFWAPDKSWTCHDCINGIK